MSEDYPDEDPEIIYKALWLQERIFERGLRGVHYMETGEAAIRAEGEEIVRKRLESDLPKKI